MSYKYLVYDISLYKMYPDLGSRDDTKVLVTEYYERYSKFNYYPRYYGPIVQEMRTCYGVVFCFIKVFLDRCTRVVFNENWLVFSTRYDIYKVMFRYGDVTVTDTAGVTSSVNNIYLYHVERELAEKLLDLDKVRDVYQVAKIVEDIIKYHES